MALQDSLRMLLLSLLLACIANGRAVMADTVVQTDPAIEGPVWEGWGTSLCWWAHIIGDYSETSERLKLRTQLIDMSFARSGLMLNIARYNIGGGENPKTSDSFEFRSRVPGYKPGPNSPYDWARDAGQRYVLLQAISHGANHLEAFSNSPPWWMTMSGTVRGAPGGGNNLKDDCYDEFADYLTEVTRHFSQSWGITFETLDPMNEPGSGYWNADTNTKQEGCCFFGAKQSDIVEKVGARLAAAGLKTRVSAGDETNTTQAFENWDALRPAAKDYVWRINTHTYNGGSEHWINSRAARDSKRLWMSEYGDGDPTGMTLARRIMRDLKVMQPTGWVYWQVVDGGWGWGCVDLDLNNRSQEYTINRKYYIYGQFTRFIRPGSILLSTSDVNSVAALNSKKNLLTLVTANYSSERQTIAHDLSRFSTVGHEGVCWVSDQSKHNWAEEHFQVNGKKFCFELPPKSVVTFQIPVSYVGKSFHGWYQLRSGISPEVIGSPSNSAKFGDWLKLQAPGSGYNQQFRLDGLGDGRCNLVNRANGLALSIDFTNSESPLMQWEPAGDDWRSWRLQDLDSGRWHLQSAHGSGLSLTNLKHPGGGKPDAAVRTASEALEQGWLFDFKNEIYP